MIAQRLPLYIRVYSLRHDTFQKLVKNLNMTKFG
jgi:hypothetical protein